jgi:N-acetylmuramoyl-L-alanine amidase
MRHIKKIVIHCSATAIDKPYTFEDLERDHKKRGFRTVGYHFYIRRDGTVNIGRPITAIGAHAKGYNGDSIGISYEGGIIPGGRANNPTHAKDTRTEAQKLAIEKIIAELYHTIGDYQDMSDVEILGHRDLSPDLNGDGEITPNEYMKLCPCFDVKDENYERLIYNDV